MTDRMTTAEYLERHGNHGNLTKSSKYKNVKVKIDGINFDSKAEAAYYEYLKLLIRTGDVSYFLMQVPFLCGGGVKYRLDFQVHYADGSIQNIDVKGCVNQAFKNKKKQVEDRYPINIRCLFKQGDRFVERFV